MNQSRWIFAALVALILTAMGTSAQAAGSTGERIALKAARGVDNVVLGLVTEWPKTIYYRSKAHGLPYGMTVGIVEGLAVGVARTGVGVYELATFPLPYPAGYQPLLSPEFSLEPGETRLAR